MPTSGCPAITDRHPDLGFGNRRMTVLTSGCPATTDSHFFGWASNIYSRAYSVRIPEANEDLLLPTNYRRADYPLNRATIAAVLVGAVVVAIALQQSENAVKRPAVPNKVTVVYWEKWTGSEGEEMRKVVDAFNRTQNRIFVRYLSISGINDKTMLATAGGNPPDVAGLWAEQVTQFADANALTDLTEVAKQNGVAQSNYIASYWDMLTYKDRLWALPSTPASTALHVRRDLVPPEYRSPETFPRTIEGLDALVAKVSKKDASGKLQLAGFLPSEPGWWNWAWGYWFGGKLVDGNKLTINTPENLRAYEWVGSYAKRFGSQEVQNFQSGFGGFASPQDAFMSGKVSTVLQGVYKSNYIKIYKPELDWFATPFPHPANRPDLANRSVLGMDVLMIPHGAKHVPEAFEFIKYVQRQDVMEALCMAHGKNSPLAKVSDYFLAHHSNKFIKLFDQLARSPGAFAAPKIGMIAQITQEMGNVFQEINTGQKPAKAALQDAQVRLDSEWDTYQTQILGEK